MSDLNTGCRFCKHATGEYTLSRQNRYPTTSIYVQCEVPISEQLLAILPTSFLREPAIRIGAVHPDTNEDVYFNKGEDCPCFEKK